MSGRCRRASPGSWQVQPALRPVLVVDDQDPAVAGALPRRAGRRRRRAYRRLRMHRQVPRRGRTPARGSRGRGRRSPRRSRPRAGLSSSAGAASWASRPPTANDGDLVAELDRLVDVVGDEHDGLAELGLQPEELVLQLARAPPGRRRRTARPSASPAGRRPAPGPPRPAAAGHRTAAPDTGLANAAVQADPLQQLRGARPGPRACPGPAAPARSRRCPARCGAGTARRSGSRSRCPGAARRRPWWRCPCRRWRSGPRSARSSG